MYNLGNIACVLEREIDIHMFRYNITHAFKLGICTPAICRVHCSEI